MAASYATVISTVKLLIEALTPQTSYLRARNLSEANIKILKTLLDKPVAIHGNLPVISSSGTPITGNFLQAFPLEVWFMDKLASKDAEGTQVDTSLQITKDLLDQFADRLSRSIVIDEANSLLEYSAEAVRTRFSDDLLTGWLFSASIPVQRDNYCIWETLFHIYAAFILEEAEFIASVVTEPAIHIVNTGWRMRKTASGAANIIRVDPAPNVEIGDTVTAVLDFDVIINGNGGDQVTFLFADIAEVVAIGSVGAGNSGQISVTQVIAALTIADWTIMFQTLTANTSEVVITKLAVTVVKP